MAERREKTYKCATCNKEFSRKNNMVVHMRTHSGVKPYKCDECGKLFLQSSKLGTHKFVIIICLNIGDEINIGGRIYNSLLTSTY